MATRATLATIQSTAITTETVKQFNTPAVETVVVGINVTAASGTSPTLNAYLEVLGSDGVWYTVWKTGTAITAAGQTVAVVGPISSSNPAAWTYEARLRLETGGTTPSFTLSATVFGN